MVRGQGSRAPPRGYLRPLPGGCPGSGAMAEEAMASYLYTAYHPYSYRYPPPKGKGGAAGGWRPRGSSSYYSGYGEAAAEYFDNYQRAQLKAILSQVNPNLTPRLRKANTKEVGVQVNPRQDASVQCSLGRRTLLRRPPGPAAPRPREAQREQELGSPATTNTRAVRFPRTIAVYSPVASRRLTAFLEEPSPEPERRPQQDKAPAVEEEPAALREQRAAEAAAVRASWEKPPEVGAEPLEQRSAAPPEPATEESQEQPAEPSAQAGAAEPSALAEPSAQAGAAEPAAQPAEPPASPQKQQQASAGKTRLRFQFLEQKYGYYHCKACNIRWESAYVWCVQGTNKVYFRQFCRTCQKSYNPYRVEDITCQSCKQTRCTCPVKMRHVDPKRPHRQDLCGRCKGKRLSCDSTFSFKYII
ncbi:zygote arrest protein 1 [Melozone crissalis]|uniref:zygote arrest protein 1 n=1 Tax=Melozone crissalis TaxID=40204 RepID=UPI0023DA6EF1|nr:zygote arrest protein 1 [Melozone crissalis]